ncbi:MAG: hypothetical protein JW889_11035 [Verrucomicrobia bacterium]|nr:hypothetical protein [Verrucomicrobiota bacterium]
MRARIVALLLIALCAAGPACAIGFLTQKELAGRDGDQIVVVPAYTYVTVTQRFGEHAIISYRDDDQVRELRVTQTDLAAVQPVEEAAEPADPATLAAFYEERVPFDVYIDEFRESAVPDGTQDEPRPVEYRIRIKTSSLVPEVLPVIRFEVQVYIDPTPDPASDAPQPLRGNRLWQLRVLGIQPREIRRVETPIFSADDVRAPSAKASSEPRQNQAVQGALKPEKATSREDSAEPKAPTLRFAVRLFVDDLFIAQRTGIVRRIEEKPDEAPSWAAGIPYFGGTSYRRPGMHPHGVRGR